MSRLSLTRKIQQKVKATNAPFRRKKKKKCALKTKTKGISITIRIFENRHGREKQLIPDVRSVV